MIGKILTISGPRGCGKSTLIEHLHAEYSIPRVVPYTTRSKRAGEQEGVDYHYVEADEFERIYRDKGMFDVLDIGTTRYGTPISDIQRALDTDDIHTFNLATRTSLRLRESFGRRAVVTSLILPAKWEDLIAQMRSAGVSEEEIGDRIEHEPNDLSLLPQFDRVFMNRMGQITQTITELMELIDEMRST